MAETPRPLGLYLGEDGKIWVEDAQLSRGWTISPASGPSTNYPMAPAEPATELPPMDGNQYGITNQAWSPIVVPPPSPIKSDAPSDGNLYARQNAAWTKSAIQTDAPSDGNYYVRQNGLWVPGPYALSSQIFTITTTGAGTWNKPANAKWIKAIVIGDGAGGASGRRSASGTAASGGVGGGGGAWSIWEGPANLVPAVVYYNVGPGGNGGAAQTANDTNGNAGTNGAGTWWGGAASGSMNALCWGQGGYGGPAGGVVAIAAAGTSAGVYPGGPQGATSITGNSPMAVYPGIPGTTVAYLGLGAGGGGGGGGISTAGVAYAGGGGGPGPTGARLNGTTWAAGGAAGGGNGVAPTDNNASFNIAGQGGSGGGASVTAGVNGGNGGNASAYGGGGGGGGAALDTAGNSGAGGKGAQGLLIILVLF